VTVTVTLIQSVDPPTYLTMICSMASRGAKDPMACH